MVIDGKKKRWVVNPHQFLSIGAAPVPAMSVVEQYKYPGIKISSLGSKCDVKSTLDEGLSHLTRAPLKPQQRLILLWVFLIPKLYHQLILTDTTKRYLKWLDVSVRAAIRAWLRFPKDTPTAYFHANYKDGGLSVPCLKYRVPAMRKVRLENMQSSRDVAVQISTIYPAFKKRLQHCQAPQRLGMSSVTNLSSISEAWRDSLVLSFGWQRPM